jgi:hypothetical protein
VVGSIAAENWGIFNWGEFDGWLGFLFKEKWILEGEGIYCGWIVAFP